MQQFKSIQLSHLPFKLEKMGDFLYYDGSLFSHLINEHEEDFLIKWCDQDEQFNRWLLYKTNYELLSRFFKKTAGDLELVMKNPDGFAYLVDIDNDIEWRHIFLVAVEDLPPAYLPEAGAFYNAERFEPYAEQLHAYLDLHFARQRKLFSAPESPAIFAAEPPSPEYRKK